MYDTKNDHVCLIKIQLKTHLNLHEVNTKYLICNQFCLIVSKELI